MKMRDLAKTITKTPSLLDKDVTVLNKETGEILYAVGFECNIENDDKVILQTVSYGDKIALDRIADIDKELQRLLAEKKELMLGLVNTEIAL